MASGRVGGTRSKVRGLVGDIVYQVVRNADGSYTQMSYGKAENVTNTITPRRQAQRMCTAMVEALMRDLKPIGNICMQSAANKSKSLNAFSSFNLQLVANDCKNYWFGGGRFYYPSTNNVGTESEQLGGQYMLSSGTWQYNGFDSVLFTDDVAKIWPYSWALGKWFAGVKFSVRFGQETFNQFLKRHFMSPLDSICFACFHDWYDWEEDPEDPTWFTRHSYIIAKVNASIDLNALVTSDNFTDLFVIESDWNVKFDYSSDGKDLYLGIMVDHGEKEENIYTYGAFTISYLEGKKKISYSSFQLVPEWSDRYFESHNPADVMGSWMGEPNIKPYPNPF